MVIAALNDGGKRVLSAEPSYRESVGSWSETPRQPQERENERSQASGGYAHLGIWGALRNVYPESGEQRS